MKVEKNYLNKRKERHLHSPAHVLADELSNRLSDQAHFAFYLKMAVTHDHNLLRRLAGEVLEQKAKKPGALFAFLIKKYNAEHSKNSGSDPEPKN
jgi:hypothetical protein